MSTVTLELPVEGDRPDAAPPKRDSGRWLRRILANTLVQFAIGGLLLFAIYAAVGSRAPSVEAKTISIGDGQIRLIRDAWAAQFGRPPNRAELAAAVAGYADEEMRYREAVAMGLADDDSVVRRRLAQKYTFLFDDPSVIARPGQAVLFNFYLKNRSRYDLPARYSFCQRTFGLNDARSAADFVARTGTGAGPSQPAELDGLYPFHRCYDVADLVTIRHDFGANFAAAIPQLAAGRWQGPIQSGYGLHAVLISSMAPRRGRDFAAVRDAVEADWRAHEVKALQDKSASDLARKYRIQLDQSAIVRLASERR